jgi:hypothetical protein
VGVVGVAPAPAKADVLTAGGDGLRTGWYADQQGLGPSSVSAADFGQLFSTVVNGQVYAQPLVSQGTVFVATETNDIYGLDPANGSVKWTRNLGVPWKSADLNCGDLGPNVGITGTPVIDPATNTAYFFKKTYASGTTGPAAWFVHAVDVATGVERSGFPVAITGNASNAPTTQFGATNQMQRPGLALMNGVVYAGFGGHCDVAPYQGWVVGVSTLGAITTLWTTEDHTAGQEGAGIWQSGGGLVNDKPGSLVLATGNGDTLAAPTPGSTPPATGWGESVIRLNVQPNGSLAVADFFTPYDALQLNGFDGDLGSGAPVALPPTSFGTPTIPRLLVEVGKEGYVYLLNADDMGGYKQGSGGGDAVVNRVGPDGGVWAKPTPWGGDGGYVYVPTASPGPAAFGSSGFMHAYKYGLDGTGKPTLSLAGSSADGFGFGSGSAVVTSDGTSSGSAVVWTLWTPNPNSTAGQLRAYDPVPVNGTLQLRRSFPVGAVTKFSVPSASGNRLYVGTRDGHVLGFGRPVNAVLTSSAVTFPNTTVGTTANATATFTAQQATTITSSAVAGAPFSITGPSTPPEGTAIPAGGTVAYPLAFTPTAVGSTSGTLTLTTAQGIATAALSGTGQSPNPLLTVNPTAISFGGIATGTSRSASVTLANAGAQPVTISSITPPATPFSATGLPAIGATIPSGGSVSVTLAFSPTAAGQFVSSLVVASNGGTVQVDLTGSAGAPALLQVSPTTLTYPTTPANGASDLTFTVTNAGGTDLTITKSKPPAGGAFSAVTALPEGSRIAAGQSVIEKVRFIPPAAGSYTGMWELNGDGASTATTVQMSGTGTANTGIPAPPGGGWIYNGTATQQGPLTVLTPAANYSAGTAFWPQGVDPSTIKVSFDLTIDQGTGADGATFAMVPSNTSTEGTGTEGGGFGWAGLGGTVIVFNTYNGNNVSVRTPGVIVVSNGSIPTLRNATNHVDITMTPGHVKVSIGGTQVIDTNVTLPASARVGFTAGTGGLNDRHAVSNVVFNGIAPPGTLTATPPATDFGTVAVGQVGYRTVTLTNTGSGPVQLTGSTAPVAPFSATLPANGATLAAGTSVNVPVRYAPTAVAASSGSITFQSNGGNQTVSLGGAGTSTAPTSVPAPSAAWSLNGNASMSGSMLVVTPNVADQAGSAFWTQSVDTTNLSAAFDLTIDQGTGADGATFAVLPASSVPTGVGLKGGGLGWSGLGGFAVTFDTYQNGTDPSANFVGVATSANGDVITYAATNTTVPPLKNATRHVVVTTGGGRVKVTIDGTQVLDAGGVTIPASAIVGFSAGTGGMTDRHAITNTNITMTPPVAGTPLLSVTPTSVPFGLVNVGTTATSSVTIRNTGTAPLKITSTTPPSAPFSATLPANGTTINVNGSVSVPVSYTPTSTASSTGSFTIASDGGSATVTLSGQGRTGGTTLPTPWSGTGWSINGNASISGTNLILTSNTVNQAGSALTTGTVAYAGLAASFDLTIDQGSGADGACFVLVPGSTAATAVGTRGGGMGWSGLGGTAVCFDTYRNGSEPSSNFVGIRTSAGYVATSTAIPVLRNATVHVDVTVTGGNLVVKVAGTQVLSRAFTTTNGRVGFSGGTGGLTDRHLVKNVVITTA